MVCAAKEASPSDLASTGVVSVVIFGVVSD